MKQQLRQQYPLPTIRAIRAELKRVSGVIVEGKALQPWWVRHAATLRAAGRHHQIKLERLDQIARIARTVAREFKSPRAMRAAA